MQCCHGPVPMLTFWFGYTEESKPAVIGVSNRKQKATTKTCAEQSSVITMHVTIKLKSLLVARKTQVKLFFKDIITSDYENFLNSYNILKFYP